MKGLPAYLVIAVILLGSGIASGELLSGSPEPSELGVKAAPKHATPGLRISGHVGGLYPGAHKRIRVELRNRSSRPIAVRALRTRVKRAAKGCGRRNLLVREVRLRKTVPAGGRKSVRVPITMTANASDACQDVRFPLRFQARLKR